MHGLTKTLLLCTTLLGLGGSALAAKPGAVISDQARARRDADKVFDFIKFHAVRPAPKPQGMMPTMGGGAAGAADAESVRNSALARVERSLAPEQLLREAPTAAGGAESRGPAVEPTRPAEPVPVEPPPAAASAALAGAPDAAQALVSRPAPPSEPEPELGLQLLEHVEPQLPRQWQHQLSSGKVLVRFLVGQDGRVQRASAQESAQRRLAQAAVRAVEQWRFAPLNAEREAEVEIVFNLD